MPAKIPGWGYQQRVAPPTYKPLSLDYSAQKAAGVAQERMGSALSQGIMKIGGALADVAGKYAAAQQQLDMTDIDRLQLEFQERTNEFLRNNMDASTAYIRDQHKEGKIFPRYHNAPDRYGQWTEQFITENKRIMRTQAGEEQLYLTLMGSSEQNKHKMMQLQAQLAHEEEVYVAAEILNEDINRGQIDKLTKDANKYLDQGLITPQEHDELLDQGYEICHMLNLSDYITGKIAAGQNDAAWDVVVNPQKHLYTSHDGKQETLNPETIKQLEGVYYQRREQQFDEEWNKAIKMFYNGGLTIDWVNRNKGLEYYEKAPFRAKATLYSMLTERENAQKGGRMDMNELYSTEYGIQLEEMLLNPNIRLNTIRTWIQRLPGGPEGVGMTQRNRMMEEVDKWEENGRPLSAEVAAGWNMLSNMLDAEEKQLQVEMEKGKADADDYQVFSAKRAHVLDLYTKQALEIFQTADPAHRNELLQALAYNVAADAYSEEYARIMGQGYTSGEWLRSSGIWFWQQNKPIKKYIKLVQGEERNLAGLEKKYALELENVKDAFAEMFTEDVKQPSYVRILRGGLPVIFVDNPRSDRAYRVVDRHHVGTNGEYPTGNLFTYMVDDEDVMGLYIWDANAEDWRLAEDAAGKIPYLTPESTQVDQGFTMPSHRRIQPYLEPGGAGQQSESPRRGTNSIVGW